MRLIPITYKQADQRKPSLRFVEMPFRYASCHSDRIPAPAKPQRKDKR